MNKVKRIYLDSLTLNFHLITVAYKENDEYHGLTKLGYKKTKGTGQIQADCVLVPDNSTTKRVQLNRMITANNGLSKFAIPYSYNQKTYRRNKKKGLFFRPKDVPEEFAREAIRNHNKSIGDDELNKIYSISLKIRDIVLEKALNEWGRFANAGGHSQYTRIENKYNFTASLNKIVDREISGYWEIIKSFTDNRDPSELPEDSLYRIEGYLGIGISPKEWQSVIF